MTTREVQGLRHVRILQSRPNCIPQGRPRGAKAAGVRYEEAVAASSQFASARHGVWFEFDDAKGHGYAQADFLLGWNDGIIVAEAKLTWTVAAYPQLRKLYFPLLRQLSGCPVSGVVICQNLTRETPRAEVVGSLSEACAMICGNPASIPILHLPLLLKEPYHAKRTKPRVPSWWRKGQAASGVGGSRGHQDTPSEIAFGRTLAEP